MVAVGAASNACGTINPIKEISKYATELEIHGINTSITIPTIKISCWGMNDQLSKIAIRLFLK